MALENPFITDMHYHGNGTVNLHHMETDPSGPEMVDL